MKIKERNRLKKEKVYKIIATEEDLKELGTELAEEIANECFKPEPIPYNGYISFNRYECHGNTRDKKLNRIKTIIQDNMDFFIPEDPDLAKEITNAVYKELTIENLI